MQSASARRHYEDTIAAMRKSMYRYRTDFEIFDTDSLKSRKTDSFRLLTEGDKHSNGWPKVGRREIVIKRTAVDRLIEKRLSKLHPEDYVAEQSMESPDIEPASKQLDQMMDEKKSAILRELTFKVQKPVDRIVVNKMLRSKIKASEKRKALSKYASVEDMCDTPSRHSASAYRGSKFSSMIKVAVNNDTEVSISDMKDPTALHRRNPFTIESAVAKSLQGKDLISGYGAADNLRKTFFKNLINNRREDNEVFKRKDLTRQGITKKSHKDLCEISAHDLISDLFNKERKALSKEKRKPTNIQVLRDTCHSLDLVQSQITSIKQKFMPIEDHKQSRRKDLLNKMLKESIRSFQWHVTVNKKDKTQEEIIEALMKKKFIRLDKSIDHQKAKMCQLEDSCTQLSYLARKFESVSNRQAADAERMLINIENSRQIKINIKKQLLNSISSMPVSHRSDARQIRRKAEQSQNQIFKTKAFKDQVRFYSRLLKEFEYVLHALHFNSVMPFKDVIEYHRLVLAEGTLMTVKDGSMAIEYLKACLKSKMMNEAEKSLIDVIAAYYRDMNMKC